MLRQALAIRIRPRQRSSAAVFIALITAGLAQSAHAQRDDYSGPPINYMEAAVNDPVAKLARQVETGVAKLPYHKTQGYLPAVLKALNIPISSQTLVFSKTSMQRSRISPRRPRAIYFNDDVYVGFVQNGGVIEFAATDARQGATFYTLEQSADVRPQFIRDQGQCLTCHSSSRTQNVPGYLIRSVFANAGGLGFYLYLRRYGLPAKPLAPRETSSASSRSSAACSASMCCPSISMSAELARSAAARAVVGSSNARA